MKAHEHIGRNRLEEAIKRYEETYYQSFEETNEEFHYSSEYLRKMQGLKRKSQNPFFACMNTAWKRVAVFAASFLLIFSSMLTVSAVREPVVQFLVEMRQEVIRLFFAEEDIEKAPERIEEMYLITALPENSKWLTQFINEKDITTTWANDDVNVTLIQATLDSTLFANTDPFHFEHSQMAGYQVAIMRNISVTIYIWNTDDYIYYLVIKGFLSDDTCADMMKSLTLQNWEPTTQGGVFYES